MMKIITARPKGMPYDDYKTYLRSQSKAIKQYKRGKLIWLSKLFPTVDVMQELRKDNWEDTESPARLLTTGETFVGDTKELS